MALEFGVNAKPLGPSRVSKTHLAAFGIYGAMVLSILVVGGVSMDHMPWGLAMLMAIPMPVHFALYKGAAAGKLWARYGSVLVGVLMLPVLPIGTLIGGFLIFNASVRWHD